MIPNIDAMRLAFRRAGVRSFYCNVWGEAKPPFSGVKPIVGDAHLHWRDAERARFGPAPSGVKVLYRLRIRLKGGCFL